MSKTDDTTTNDNSDDSKMLPPLVSAVDVVEANYPRAHFDGNIAWTIEHQSKQRAPTETSVWRHQVGLAGEIAVGAHFGVRADWNTYADYEGDDGYDMTYRGNRIEVKTVTRKDDLQLKVPSEQVETAEYFVLARAAESLHMVELVGYTTRPVLKAFGKQSPYDNLVRLGPQYLCPLAPGRGPISPEQIRATQSI